MVLVLLLTLIPAQAAEETDTGTDEGEKTCSTPLRLTATAVRWGTIK